MDRRPVSRFASFAQETGHLSDRLSVADGRTLAEGQSSVPLGKGITGDVVGTVRTPCRKKRGVPLGKGGTNVETPGGDWKVAPTGRQECLPHASSPAESVANFRIQAKRGALPTQFHAELDSRPGLPGDVRSREMTNEG
jgi:hypothetical protein